MKKTGRPTKLDKKMKERLKVGYLLGLTDVQVCTLVDIDESTLAKWKQRFPEFFKSIKSWKAEADAKVECSLYERACGFEHPEDKIFCNNGEIIVEPTTRHYPPDATSMIFWLKNRQPHKWRDKTDIDLTDTRMVQKILAALPPDVSEKVRENIASKAKDKK